MRSRSLYLLLNHHLRRLRLPPFAECATGRNSVPMNSVTSGAPMGCGIHSYNLAVLDCAPRTSEQMRFDLNQQRMEELRSPVGRPDFKSGRGCQQSLVGSTPTLFRHPSSLLQ